MLLAATLSWLPMLLNFSITSLADQEIAFLFPKFCVYIKELLPCLIEFIMELEITYSLCFPDESIMYFTQ